MKRARVEGEHGKRRRSRQLRGLRPITDWLLASGALLAVGCFGQKPSGEGAPSAAPQASPAPPPPSTDAAAVRPEPEKKGAEPPVHPTPASAPAATGAGGAIRNAPAEASAPGKARRKADLEAPKASEDRADSIGGTPTEPQALRRRLDRAYRAQSADCPAARDRKKAVCDLATQICSLTDRDPDVASVAEYCDDARRRCSEAERRTEERCPS
jgi:hypothetical protein